MFVTITKYINPINGIAKTLDFVNKFPKMFKCSNVAKEPHNIVYVNDISNASLLAANDAAIFRNACEMRYIWE